MNTENEQWAMAGLLLVGFILTGLGEDATLLGAAIMVGAGIRLGYLIKQR